MVTIIVKLNCKTKKYNECLAYKVLKIVLTGLTQGARSMSVQTDVDFVLFICHVSIAFFIFYSIELESSHVGESVVFPLIL